jgi:dynein heavy chain
MREEVDTLQKKVLYTQEVIDDMLIVQKNWIYLENIFKSNEIRVKLREETAMFEKVDNFFKKQMSVVKKNLKVTKCVKDNSKKEWAKQKEALSQI